MQLDYAQTDFPDHSYSSSRRPIRTAMVIRKEATARRHRVMYIVQNLTTDQAQSMQTCRIRTAPHNIKGILRISLKDLALAQVRHNCIPLKSTTCPQPYPRAGGKDGSLHTQDRIVVCSAW